jgi:N-acetyl sugar amidotransferase
MDLFFRCKNCLFPSTKPDLHFNENGVCMACKYTDYYKNIDWDKRKQEFFELVDKFKSKNDNSNYDCTIAVSGGKDSTYQTHLIKEAGLKPLLLNFEPSYPTKVGKKNLQNLVDTFGFDLIEIKKSPVYKKLAKIGFDIIGDHEWPNHVGIFVWPIRMANQFNIPITFYGEPRGIIGQGRWDTFEETGVEEMKRSDIEQYIGMNGFRLSDIIQHDKSITSKDVIPYTYPEDLKVDIKGYDLGHYFEWEFKKNLEIIKNYGWQELDTNVEGTFVNFEDLDCGFMPIHQYFKFIKYGYGRATDHACYEIRQGRMTKKQAKELIIDYDGKVPVRHFKRFLEFLDIDEEYFFSTVDRFANPLFFEKDDQNKYVRDNTQNLILKKIWYDSFDV